MNRGFVKRSRLEIIYEILSLCRTSSQKTRILYRCNLSFEQLQKYLEYLILNGLLDASKKDNRMVYQITQKGKEFLDEYEKLKQLIREAHKNNFVKNYIGKKGLDTSPF